MKKFRTHIRLGEHDKTNTLKACDPKSSLDCNENVQDFIVEKIIVHPSYNKPHHHRNDIAVVKLKTEINENGKIIIFLCVKEICWKLVK